MPFIRAEVTLAVEAGPRFLAWSRTRRRELEQAVADSIDKTVGRSLQVQWASVPLEVNSRGEAEDESVRAVLARALADTVSDSRSNYVLTLAGESAATPSRIGRSYTAGVQHREYCYLLERRYAPKRKGHRPSAAKPWIIAHKTEPVHVLAKLAWTTSTG